MFLLTRGSWAPQWASGNHQSCAEGFSGVEVMVCPPGGPLPASAETCKGLLAIFLLSGCLPHPPPLTLSSFAFLPIPALPSSTGSHRLLGRAGLGSGIHVV